MFKKIGIVYRTVRYLTAKQILYRVLYILKFNRVFQTKLRLNNKQPLNLFSFILPKKSFFLESNEFLFLNKKVCFPDRINWNFSENGKLWTYNLCYLDFINQKDLKINKISEVLNEFHLNYSTIISGKDPYPTSLRIINLIKKLSNRKYDSDKNLEQILIFDIKKLFNSIEYHLLGNHLLENGFALYFAAHVYPKNNKIRSKAIKILRNELEEQILSDGAHFERSLMYHQIILSRLLECISLSKSNPQEWNSVFLDFLIQKAEKMLGWLNSITEKGKVFVRFNDSIEGISPTALEIFKFSKSLKLKSVSTTLTDSGFRKFKSNDLLIITNTGGIISDYQPGHSHANTFSFLLFEKSNPIIVDPGITTYENNQSRLKERSSANHNTINVQGINNNEIWSSFRIGRRAKVKIVQENCDYIKAIHNGYFHINILHSRSWKIEKNSIVIIDELIDKKSTNGEFNIHLHPKVELQKIASHKVLLNDNIIIEINSDLILNISSYDYSIGFNNSIKSKKIYGLFQSKLKTKITIH